MRSIQLPEGEWVSVAASKVHHELRVARATRTGIEVSESHDETRRVLAQAEVDPYRVHALVQTKTTFMPHTAFKDVWYLPPKDTVEFRREGSAVQGRLTWDHPYLSRNRTFRVPYSRKRLDELLTEAVESCLEGNETPILLLSEGKDSVPLARALSAAGVRAHCVTFADRGTDTESFSSRIARKYGHSHDVVDFGSLSLSSLLSYCRELPAPSADQAVLGYCWLAHTARGSLVLDGQAAEAPMGSGRSGKSGLRFRLARTTSWDVVESVRRRQLLPPSVAYGVSWPRQGWHQGFRKHLHRFVRSEFLRLTASLDEVDGRINCYTRGVTVDYNLKGSLWDLAGTLRVRRPWAHDPLADWFADAESRGATGTSRGWLLRYLDEVEDYSTHIRGKRGFDFPVARMLGEVSGRSGSAEPGRALRELLTKEALGSRWTAGEPGKRMGNA